MILLFINGTWYLVMHEYIAFLPNPSVISIIIGLVIDFVTTVQVLYILKIMI